MKLIDITKDNWWDVLCLTTNETITVKGSGEPYEAKGMPSLCEEFVASNALSIVESVYEKGWTIKALEHEGELVGFTMYGREEDDDEEDDGEEKVPEICRLMIDRRFQNRGLGTQALRMIVDEVRASRSCSAVILSTDPENARGLHVYHKLGFKETGEMDGDEAILRLELGAPEAEKPADTGVYELEDTEKARPLFEKWVALDTGVLSCLDKVMGKIYVTDREAPKSAMAVCADFVFVAGEPDLKLLRNKPGEWKLVIPENEAWAKLIEDNFPAYKRVRYAMRKDNTFDREKLEGFVRALPEGCELRKFDAEIYDICKNDEEYEDCVANFGSKAKFFELGRGWAVMRDGKFVGAASSYSRYGGGIDIEIDINKDERNKGLGSAVAAKLILSCLDEGLYPAWDAACKLSVRLAEKLGYVFSHEYAAYVIE
ncbi:MAG: GNAT family N-acetyltransferase [Oscillospiraceae bacterium]|nr:GNAT family N-acetyltransferase [Oscillospiraceae bacterium]